MAKNRSRLRERPKRKKTRKPSKGERRQRQMLIPTSRGVTPTVIRGSEQASQLGRYMAAVGKFAHWPYGDLGGI